MRSDLNDIVKTFEKKIPRKVIAIYDGGDKYLIASESKTANKFANLDPYYTIFKSGKDIRGFNPMTNIKWYNKAINNLVYGEEPEQESSDEMLERMLAEIDKEME